MMRKYLEISILGLLMVACRQSQPPKAVVPSLPPIAEKTGPPEEEQIKDVLAIEDRLDAGNDGAAQELLSIGLNPSSRVRAQALEGMLRRRVPGDQFTSPLLTLMHDSEEMVSYAAARVLFQYDPVSGVHEVVGLLQDLNPIRRERAARWTNGVSAGGCAPPSPGTPPEVTQLSDQIALEAVPVLLNALQTDESAAVRREAVTTLGLFACKGGQIPEAIKAALKDRDARVRMNAAWAMGQNGLMPKEEADAIRAKNEPEARATP